MINEYTMLESLGEGSYGKVKSCRVGNVMFAMKIFHKGILRRKKEFIKNPNGGMAFKTALDDVENEIEVMRKINHPNCLKLHKVLDDDEEDKLYMLLDYAANGTIMEWDPDRELFYNNRLGTRDFSEDEIRGYLRDMLKGLNYLHNTGILHRDIKP